MKPAEAFSLLSILLISACSPKEPDRTFTKHQTVTASTQSILTPPKTEPLYFSFGGMLNAEYVIGKQDLQPIVNNCRKNVPEGEYCPVPKEDAQRLFKIKPGMNIIGIADSTTPCEGDISGIDFIQTVSINGFFIKTSCQNSGLYIISDSKSNLHNIKPLTPQKLLLEPTLTNSLQNRVLKYFTHNTPELRKLLAGPLDKNHKLSDEELIAILKSQFRYEAFGFSPPPTDGKPNIQFIYGEEKEIKWGARFLFAFFPDNTEKYLRDTQFIRQLLINDELYFNILYQQQGTGISVSQLLKLNGSKLDEVFTEGGYSD